MPSSTSALSRTVRKRYLSPLRYPGGKRKLVETVWEAFTAQSNGQVSRIVEPFSGGAAMSIALVEAGLAREAVINDFDPLVAAFWSVVFSSRSEDLVDLIIQTEVTLDTWHRIRQSEPACQIGKAFKCLFLNRTSFSGSLSAGPIGGLTQTGKYRLPCRWNPGELATRIRALSKLSDRFTVRNLDFRECIRRESARADEKVFWYLDPPYFHKAQKLYRHWFEHQDHADLELMTHHLPGCWALSYDLCPEARTLYAGHAGAQVVEMRHTAAGSQKAKTADKKELLIYGWAADTLHTASIPSALPGLPARAASEVPTLHAL